MTKFGHDKTRVVRSTSRPGEVDVHTFCSGCGALVAQEVEPVDLTPQEQVVAQAKTAADAAEAAAKLSAASGQPAAAPAAPVPAAPAPVAEPPKPT